MDKRANQMQGLMNAMQQHMATMRGMKAPMMMERIMRYYQSMASKSTNNCEFGF